MKNIPSQTVEKWGVRFEAQKAALIAKDGPEKYYIVTEDGTDGPYDDWADACFKATGCGVPWIVWRT